MTSALRFIGAVAICLSGWALLPFVALPNLAIGWERFADAYGEIFLDSFESGDTSAWSFTMPPMVEMVFIATDNADDYRAWFRGDAGLLEDDPGYAYEMLSGWSANGVRIFGLEARLVDGTVSLRSRVRRDDGTWAESRWAEIREQGGFVEVEWRRAREATNDGVLYVAVNDRLLLWHADLDNDLEALEHIGILQYQGVPVLLEVTPAHDDM